MKLHKSLRECHCGRCALCYRCKLIRVGTYSPCGKWVCNICMEAQHQLVFKEWKGDC